MLSDELWWNKEWITECTDLDFEFEYTVKPTDCTVDNISDLEFERLTTYAPVTTELIISSVFAGIAGVVFIAGFVFAILKYQGISLIIKGEKSDRSVSQNSVV